MRDLIFLISEAQRNFRNELFDSVEAQHNSAIAERHFRTKLKRNLPSAKWISQHNANTAVFATWDKKEQIIAKEGRHLLILRSNGTKWSSNSMYRMAQLTEKKKLKAQRN